MLNPTKPNRQMKKSIPLGFIGGSRKRKRRVDKSERVVSIFSKGSVVEVSTDNHHGFEGAACSWFEATIIDLPNPTATKRATRNSVLVKYHTLITAGSKPLKQYVHPSRVRPLPPLIEPDDSSFELNCVVDAFFRDGWRTGVIIKADENNSKFRVLFQNPAEEVEFDRNNLRVPQDWVDGKWDLPEKKEMKHQRVGMKTLKKRIARPRKFETTNVPAAGEEQLEAADTADATVVQDSAGLSQDSTITQGNEAWKSEEEIVRHSLGFDAVGENMPVENQKLPFVRRSPVWKTFESMTVFQKMPQTPHFHSLRNCKEDFREGLAIGCMVTFATLAERTFKLQFDEPRSTIETILETLNDLEMHGFDVKVVRGQLHKSLLLKEKERQIVEHAWEKSKVEEELDEIQKKIMDLQEKRAMVKSMEASRESQMALLKFIVDDVNGKMQSLQHEFDELAAAPL